MTVEQVAADGESATLQAYAKPTPAAGDTFGLTAGQVFSAGNVAIKVDALGDSADPGAAATVTVTLANVASPAPSPTPTATVTAMATATTSPPVTVSPAAVPTLPAVAAEQSGSVAITGVPGTGATVTATPVDWTAGALYLYQWFDETTPIAGANGSSFQIPATLQGHRLSVGVSGIAAGYADHLAFAVPVLVGRFQTSVTPRIAGRRRAGHRLRAVARPAGWSPRPARFRYRWYAGHHPLLGAHQRTLKLTPRLVGKRLRVRVTGSRPGFAALTTRSRWTARVAPST